MKPKVERQAEQIRGMADRIEYDNSHRATMSIVLARQYKALHAVRLLHRIDGDACTQGCATERDEDARLRCATLRALGMEG